MQVTKKLLAAFFPTILMVDCDKIATRDRNGMLIYDNFFPSVCYDGYLVRRLSQPGLLFDLESVRAGYRFCFGWVAKDSVENILAPRPQIGL